MKTNKNLSPLIGKTKFIEENLFLSITQVIPIICVDLLLLNEGKVLLLKRKDPPAKGQWWYPGGRIFKNENIYNAAKRKGLEELGLQLEPQKIISVEESIFNLSNDEVDIHTVNIVVQMNLINDKSKIMLDESHSEYKWFDEVDYDLHPAVRIPLEKINFKIKL